VEPAQPQSQTPPARQRVWDAPTRLVHWAFVFCVALSWWSVENKSMDIHYWSGMTLVGLLVFRIYWGFAGPETARFASFIKGPGAVVGYAGKLLKRDYRASFGHNPLGALSVIAIILALILQVGLGLFASDTDGLAAGPLNHLVDYDTAEDVTDLHEDFFNVLLVLIGLHIAAIVFYLAVKRINLVGPMVTGSRRAESVEGPPGGIAPVPVWRFLIGVALAAGVVWLIAG
jgi:cytochrome b